MSKNKNKNRNNQQGNHGSKIIQPLVPTLTEEQKLEIEKKNEETKIQISEQQVIPDEQLTLESEVKLKDAEAKNDLTKYWNHVKEINKRLDALIIKTEDDKGKAIKLREELETSKKDSESIKSGLKKKLEDFNKKDRELTEREFTLDNGEYTGVISVCL